MKPSKDATLDAYHLDRLRAGLGDPPVSEKVEARIRDDPMGADVEILLRLLDHYRDLAGALAHDSGAAEAYERGRREGVIEGKRRCVEAAKLEYDPADYHEARSMAIARGMVAAIERVGVEP